MRKLFSPFKVGLFVLVALGAFIGFYSFVHKGGLSKAESLDVYAIFHDASGLEKKTRILIAGIGVGEVREISLYGGQYAKIVLRIKKTVHVHTDAAITKRSASILGEYVLDLYPGSEAAPDMPPDGQILHVFDEQGMQQVFQALGKITGDIQAVTTSLRNMMAGDSGSIQGIVSNLSQVTAALGQTVSENGERINQTLKNFEQLSAQLAALTSSQGGSVREIVENVRVASDEAKQAIATLDQILGSNKGALASNFEGLKQTLGHLSESLKNVEAITKKVDSGDGTLGRLINDQGLADKLDHTLGGAADFVDKLVNIQTEVSMQTDYLFGEAAAKGYLNLKLSPKPDKFYLFQLVDDPRGTPQYSFVQTNPPSTLQVPAQSVTTTSRSLKVSAEFGKIWAPATFRLGIIESTAGGGVDLNFWNRHVQFTTDVFDFADYFQPYPRVRSYLTYRAFDHVEVRGGADDLLNSPATRNVVDAPARGYSLGGRELFLGAGLYFTDEDLKAVLAAVPIPK